MTEAHDPLIVEMFKKMPAPDSVWPISDRAIWLRALESIFDMLYGPVEHVQITASTITEELIDALQMKPPGHIVLDREETVRASDHVDVKVTETGSCDIPDAGSILLTSLLDKEATVQEPEPTVEKIVVQQPVSKPKFNKKPSALPGYIRPSDVPTVFTMIQTILEEFPGINAAMLHARIRDKWWPDLAYKRLAPDISGAVTSGRVDRDADGKMTLSELGKKFGKPKPDPLARVEMTPDDEPAQVEKPAAPASPVVPVPPRPLAISGTNRFEHAGRSVMLTGPEFRVAEALKKAMGKGFLDYQFLGLRGRGVAGNRSTHPDRVWLSEIFMTLGPKLRSIELDAQHKAPYGYTLVEMPQ